MNNEYKTSWIFVIDTENYAGNFERGMCAYLTGEIGECGVGQQYANIFRNEVKNVDFSKSILLENDGSSCYRPVSIYQTIGWYSDAKGGFFRDDAGKATSKKYPAYLSVGIFFEKKPSQAQIDLMKSRAYQFAKLKHESIDNFKIDVKITGFRLIEKLVNITYKTI